VLKGAFMSVSRMMGKVEGICTLGGISMKVPESPPAAPGTMLPYQLVIANIIHICNS